MNQFKRSICTTLSIWQWWGLAFVSFIVCQMTMVWMEAMYVATHMPVSVFEGQTSFNSESIKENYAVLIEMGTLEAYIAVQLWDFLLMFTMFVALSCMAIAAYRSVAGFPKVASFAWGIVLVVPLAPLFDVFENLVSFIMLADPQGFVGWLAYPYSTFAVIKFMLSGLGFLWPPAVLCVLMFVNIGRFVMQFFQSKLNKMEV